MAWIRRLPSGRWAATVRTPNGRVTETRALKGSVEKWASDLEADVSRGDFVDPRHGELSVGEWWERTAGARHLERASRKRDESHWRVHVAPRWAKTPVGAILRPDVNAWVADMQRNGVGAATIQGAVGVLRALMDQAVDARLRRENPAKGVRTPRRPAHVDRVLTLDEEDIILARLSETDRLFVELLLHGLRWEEAAALDRNHVDLRRALIHVGPVLERDGSIRPYPKSPASVRDVPVDDTVWPRLRSHTMSVHPDGGCQGGPSRRGAREQPSVIGNGDTQRIAGLSRPGPSSLLFPRMHYSSWLRRRWHPAVADLDLPRPTPHDCRHTYGTRLAESGVPVHEIMALMGHASLAAAQRYLHAGEDRFDRARRAMRQARGM